MRWIVGAVVVVVLPILIVSGMAQAELSLAAATWHLLEAVVLLELRVTLRVLLSLVGISI